MGRYCHWAKVNYTIAFIEVKAGDFFIVKEKELLGSVGKIMTHYFDVEDANNHNCRFISVDSFGTQLPNQTYTGALALLKEKIVDSYGRPQTVFVNQPFLMMSTAISEEDFHTAQVLKQTVNDEIGSSLRMFEIEISLILTPLICFLLIFLLLLKLTSFKTHSDIAIRTEKILNSLLEISFPYSKAFDTISLIILFYTLYSFIFKSILTNSVKTESVIVDTSDIIDSNDDLFESTRTLCHGDMEGIGMKLFTQAPTGSFLNNLYIKSINNVDKKICVFGHTDTEKIVQFDLDKIVTFGNRVNLQGIAVMLSNFLQNRKIYSSQRSLFTINNVIHFRQNVDPYFIRICNLDFEFGLLIHAEESVLMLLSNTYRNQLQIFKTKEEYIDELSQTHNLSFTYFSDTFRCYLIANLSVSVFFLITLIWKFVPACCT